MIFKCKLCNNFKTKDALTFYHHIRTHRISTKDYYDKFMKKEADGICKYCGKQTTFININEGYHEFCSPKCASIGTTDRKIKTCLRNNGTKFPTQSKSVIEKCKKTWLKTLGVDNPSKSKKIHKKQFHLKAKAYNGYLSGTEYAFSRLLLNNNIHFKSEFLVRKGELRHYFDFAIFDSNKLKCLIEIDGRYYHGLNRDFNGIHSKYCKDYLRWSIVPHKVKFLVIDDNKLEEGIRELQRILPMKYKDWKKEMIRSIPKNIEDAIPRFSDSRLLSDWKSLCKYPYKNGAFLGKSILLNFCKSRIIKLLKNEWKSVRKTLYKSPCSEHHVLEGLGDFENPSKLREKYRKKYRDDDTIIVRHHSPEKMLAICSLGKTYVSEEPIDKESVKIISYLNLKRVYEISDS